MKNNMRAVLAAIGASVLMSTVAFAGALTLELGNGSASPEAKNMHALLVAQVTSCHEPAKSVVKANTVRIADGNVQRTPLKVMPLSSPGMFAIVGMPPGDSAAVEISVTNPEYQNYEPRLLVKVDASGMQRATLKRFWNGPPSTEEVKTLLAAKPVS